MSGGRLSCDDRSGAENLIRGHGPLRSCIKRRNHVLKLGTLFLMQCGRCRKTSGGRLSCDDRSGAENLIWGHGPLRSCIKRRNHVLKLGTLFLMQCGRCRKTSGGRLSCDDRSGAETLDPWGQGPLPLLKSKRAKP